MGLCKAYTIVKTVEYHITNSTKGGYKVEERKNKIIKVKELVIHADEVHIINQQAGHESTKDIEQDSNESNRRGPWDFFWGNRDESKQEENE